MTLSLTNEELRALIPNVFKEAPGEALLIDKMLPWLTSAAKWLTDNFIGDGYPLEDEFLPLANKIIVTKAFADAAPSLDLSLTPAGFSVINTDGRAPASKDRVERLIASFLSSVDANLQSFIFMLLHNEQWRNSSMGQYWLGSFMRGLDDAMASKRDNDLLSTYRSMRQCALLFETELARNYLGTSLMNKLRLALFDHDASPDDKKLWQMIHLAELRYISSHIRNQKLKCPDRHEVWHLAEPILREIQYCSELRETWQAEMGEEFDIKPFKNTRKGSFFF